MTTVAIYCNGTNEKNRHAFLSLARSVRLDALRRLGRKSMFCLREPSLGPYFGIKGGGTGAGIVIEQGMTERGTGGIGE